MFIQTIQMENDYSDSPNKVTEFHSEVVVLEVLSNICSTAEISILEQQTVPANADKDLDSFIRVSVIQIYKKFSHLFPELSEGEDAPINLIVDYFIENIPNKSEDLLLKLFCCIEAGLEGMDCYQQEKYEEAIDNFKRSLTAYEEIGGIKGFDVDSLYGYIAQSYFNIGSYQESARYLLLSNEEKIIIASAALVLGDESAYTRLSQETSNDRIAGLLMKAMGQDCLFETPNLEYLTYEHLYFRQGQYQLAIDYPHAYRPYRAVSLAMQGHFDAAIEEYTLLIQEYAGDEDRYIERGLVYLLKGNREAALLDLRKAESIEMPYYLDRCDSLFIPKSTYIIEWINTRFPVAKTAPSETEQAIFQAETFYNQGDCISAIAILEPMVTGQSMGNIEKQKIVDLLGRAYFELGNFEKAAEFFAMYQEPSFLREVCRLYFEQYQEIAITDDIISLALLMKGVNLGNRLVLHPELQGIEKLFFNDYEQFRIAADSLWKGPVFNGRGYLHSWLWTAYYLGPKAYPHVGNIESERCCALGAFCRGDREKAFRDLSVVEAGERANYGKWGSIPTTPFIVQLLNRV